MKTINRDEIYKNHCVFAQKSENASIAHIWSDELEKVLCGESYMLAYFKPDDRPICKKCLKIYRQTWRQP